jgi:hypothetical protein
MPGSQTPNYCTVASNSLCNKDFSKLEENILLAGMPVEIDTKYDFERLEKRNAPRGLSNDSMIFLK